ncbi:bifunctional DNA primase/polymerase [Mesorhizobium sp. ESP-6-2]|uniref:bifunctional DNA primase/polymerase n=1 Tax=Mesorhizobium sp. ESP-6-2 TaxID=2876625 RepID=UPI001CCD2BD8|nr:bifunctional DNA primase/polymerase [Mesorhizobium sp. ESP-6-2]MBZ9808145.1 bifunctional DNA primase/polymerase [Mesorhizobium sp. ESP-6-2]
MPALPAQPPESAAPLSLALSYAANGCPVFPCRPSDSTDPETGKVHLAKSPLTPKGFHDASLRPHVINAQFGSRHPNALIGIPTGERSGFWVLDIDVPPGHEDGRPWLAAMEERHGHIRTRIAETGSGGLHYLFKHAHGVRNMVLASGAESRGDGGYFIAPGSVMSDGRTYKWLNDEPIAEAPSWLLDLLLKPKHSPVQCTGSTSLESATAAEIDELLTYVSPDCGYQDWVSVLMAVHSALGAEGMAIADAWSAGGKKYKKGDVASKWKGFTSSGGVGLGSLAELARQGGAHLSEIARRHRGQEGDVAVASVDAVGFIAGIDERKAAAEAVDLTSRTTEPEDDVPDYQLQAVADLDTLTHPGGLVQDLIDWIVSSAEQPSRVLALAAALPMVAALMGPRYSTGSRDTRPNIYSVALAESGFGKEHARSQIKRLLAAGHGVFDRFGGPARIMSASALREVLEMHQSVNCQIDEFGGFIRDITDRRAGSHQRAISTDLRDYYSASATYFEGAAYRGNPPRRIHNPGLCIHGTSTPEQFWSALSSASAEDGLLPRLVLFNVDTALPAAVKPEQDVRYVPTMLLDRMADVAGIDVVKARTAKIPTVATSSPTMPLVVPWTEGALALFESVKEAVAEHEKRVVAEARPFVRRIIENAIKLALIVAVGIDCEQAMITEANVDWASSLAWTCAAGMLSQVTERLSDNPREANYKKILGLIRAAGSKGITVGRLADRLKSIDARQRDEIVKDLREADLVREEVANTGGRPKRRLVSSTA